MTSEQARAAFERGEHVQARSKTDQEWLTVSEAQPKPLVCWYVPDVFDHPQVFEFRIGRNRKGKAKR